MSNIAVENSSSIQSLGIQTFDSRNYAPTDLQTDSSSVSRTSQQQTESILLSIQEKRNTLKVIRANLALSSDLVKAATDYRKLEGLVIDFDTVAIENEAKKVRQETANTTLSRERVISEGERHLLDQERIRTNATGEMTPLVSEEWKMRKELARAKIEDLRRSVEKLRTTYEDTRNSLDVA